MATVYSDFDKARNVMFLFYPSEECTYGNLLNALEDIKMPCCCSPVHDKDKFTELDVKKWITNHMDKSTGQIADEVLKAGVPVEGQHKKKHVHGMLCANGPMQPIWFHVELAKRGINVNYFEKVNSVPSMMRYFAHLDNPEKAKYNPLDIHGFGGIDLSPLYKVTKLSNTQNLMEVIRHIKDKKIERYNRLFDWAVSTGDIDLINCVAGRNNFFNAYLRSLQDERMQQAQREKELRDSGYYDSNW